MAEFMTKYFGKIIFYENNDDDDFAVTNVKYNNQEDIVIFLSGYSKYGDKMKVCLEIINKYVEINKIAKKAIIDNFTENKTINYYFEYHFNILEEEQLVEIFGVNNFEKFDITNIVSKLEYPYLFFSIKNNKITVSVEYMILKEYFDEELLRVLCVKIDEKLNVTDFAHEKM
jgi:hypothetical protein